MVDESRKFSILVVDDSPENLDTLTSILSDEYMVRPAINGKLALRIASINPQPDLILLDVMMPGIDGYEVCKQLKANDQTKNIPVIFVTAKSADEDELLGLELGAVDFIIKPVRPHIVKARIRTHLDILRLNQEVWLKNRRLFEINEDLTESLEQLSASEERFKSLVQAIPDIVYKIDTEGNFTFVNEAVERLGYNQSELLGKHFTDIIYNADIKDVSLSKVLEGLESGQTKPESKVFDERRVGNRMTVGLECRLKTKSGQALVVAEIKNIGNQGVYVEVNSTGMYTKGDKESDNRTLKYLGTVGVIRDITDRKKAEEIIIEANKKAEEFAAKSAEASQAKSDFLANMSHEIRTPLNAVIGMTHLCLKTELTHQQKDYLKKSHSSAMSLLALINDILDFSKIEAGKLTIENFDFSIEEVIKNLINVNKIKSIEKGLEFIVDVKPETPQQLNGDPFRLGQILTNLTNNAIKFTEAGEVSISISVEKETEDFVVLKFAVRDSGIGMSTEQIGKLFKEFSQAEVSTTRKYGGTGLGLTISKRLVEMMDGRINVESEPDQGSCFIFTAQFKKVADLAIEEFVPPPAMQGMRVLVVDDNESVQQIVSILLNVLTFQPVCVENAEQALDELSKADAAGSPFALVLMDWKMPGMDGLDTSYHIKKKLSLNKTPAVIMMTAHAFGKEEISSHQEYGELLDGFLIKPIYMASLFDAIMIAFGHAPRNLSTSENNDLQEMISGLSGASILLAEDNEINQQVACELLEQAHIQVTVANNGQEAVELASKATFDAVLMDLHMPIMDGLEAAREIRKSQDKETLPIIAMTASAMVEDLERCLQAGMNDHVAKPVLPEQLFAALAKWIKPNRSKDVNRSIAPPPPRISSAEPQSIPLIPGIDTAVGLRFVGGNVDLYRKLLLKFSQNRHESCELMDKQLKSGNAKDLEQSAHALKGVSATIGATDVSSMAGKIENHSKTPEGLEAVPEILAALKEELATIVSGIEKGLAEPVVPENAEQDSAGLDVKPEVLEPLFRKAVKLLLSFDSKVEQVVLDIDPLIHGMARKNRLKSIQKALEVYDFETCLAEIHEWAVEEGITLDG